MFKRSKLHYAMAAFVGLSAQSAVTYAQDAETNELEEIVVTGIRQALDKSLDIKRDSHGFTDAISAEDVGKLPDQNVAEALQRVTGVAIQRSRGEGDFISIRGLGPDFVRGTINGRSLLSATEAVDPIFNGNLITSTGRAANFDVLPSEVINTLEVIKSTSAKQIEGGIGGSVDVKTARPLSLGDKYAASVQGTYREFDEDFDPNFALLGSWVNEDGDLGGLLSVSYSERSIREDFSRTFGWFPSFGISTTLDTNNDGVGDASPNDVPFPLSNNAEVYEESRDRLTLSGTIQWQLTEDSELIFDAIYSKREVAESHQNLIFLPIAFDGDLAAQTTNPDGSVQVGNLLSGGAFSTIPSSLRPELTTDLQDYEDELFAFGVNYQKQIGDWNMSADLSYSKAEGENVFDRVRIDGDNGSFAFNTVVNDGGFNITQTNAGAGASADLGNPANFVVSVFDDRLATNEDEESAIQLDFEREFDAGVLTSVEFGARWRSRDKNVSRASNGNGIGVADAGVTVAQVGTFDSGADDFLDGDWNTNIDYSSLIFPNNAAARNALDGYLSANGLSTVVGDDPFGTFDTEEDTLAAYVQFNLAGEFAGIPYVGDVGVRVVETDQTIAGFDAEFRLQDNGGMDTTVFDSLTTGAATPITFEESYTSVLPSLNLRFEVAQDLFVRLAASKSITRPTFNNLAPAFSINANSSTNLNGDNFAVSLSAGNPALEPYESINFDLGVEWYFAETSAVYAGFFHKDVDDFIAVITNNNVSSLAGEPIRAIGVELDGSSSPISIDQVSQPDNQGEAQIDGLEIGYQHDFESGFGFITNLTLTDNSAELIGTGQEIDFPGVSDTSYNLTGYYEKGPLSVRLSYSYRDEYLLVPDAIGFGGQIFADDYGQLDASFSHDLSEQLTVFANIVNVTDENQDQFTELPNGLGKRFYSESHVGRRIGVGVRGSF